MGTRSLVGKYADSIVVGGGESVQDSAVVLPGHGVVVRSFFARAKDLDAERIPGHGTRNHPRVLHRML